MNLSEYWEWYLGEFDKLEASRSIENVARMIRINFEPTVQTVQIKEGKALIPITGFKGSRQVNV